MSKSTIGTFKHPGGAPSIYDEKKHCKIVRDYIDSCEDSFDKVLHSKVKGKNKKVKSVYTTKFRVHLPTLEGLALDLHVHKDTIQEWKKKHQGFAVLISELLDKQGKRLIEMGLSGDYNPTITKVLLTKHGYREGHEVANPDGSNVFRPSEAERLNAEKALRDM